MRATLLLAAVVLLGLGIGARSVARAEGAQPPRLHPLANKTLAPALKAAAERDHIDLTSRVNDAREAGPKDAVVYWVGTLHGREAQQWLIQMTRGTATPQELARHRDPDKTKYISWGSTVVFHSDVEPLDLWIAGPADMNAGTASAKPAPVHRTRVFVPRDYLRLGLDDSERVSLFIAERVQQITKAEPPFKPGHIYALDHPIAPEKIALAKPTGDRLGLTPAMERAWMGGYVALQAFYDCVNEVPELRDIAEVAFQKPSLWKLAKLATGTHFTTSFGGSGQRIDPAKFGLFPSRNETFDMPFSFGFGRDLIASGFLVVTSPTPPLDVGAGILAAVAFHPTDPNRAVELIAISAASGTAKR